jgi:hypothetical protein
MQCRCITQRPFEEAILQSCSRLGSFNAAIVALYFAAVWGADGLRILRSPFHGFEERLHATAAAYVRAVFDCGLDGLIRISNALAALKFLIAAGFVAYLIEFLRAIAMGRAPNQDTLEWVLFCAVSALMVWAWPALVSGDVVLVRLLATEFLLLSGALIVLYVERQFGGHASETAVDLRPQPVPLVF